MAKLPTPEEIQQALGQSHAIEAAKIADQSKQGKEFKTDSRRGVVPETVWKKAKDEVKQ